jgi:hypothetical protein
VTIPVVFRNHFQMGYVVRDMDQAIANMRDKFGVSKWEVRHLPRGAAPAKTLAFAYVQQVMIELIEVWPGDTTVYHDWIPAEDHAAKLHHFGYMMESEEEWRDTIAQFEAAGVPAALTGSARGLLDYHYADTVSQLGHYCELILLSPAGRNFWANVPRN